jgi:hypothetical protein
VCNRNLRLQREVNSATDLLSFFVPSKGTLRTDSHDPLTLLELAPATTPAPESGLKFQRSRHVFLTERAACKLFGVVMYGVHIIVYEQQKGDGGVGEHALG